ncbi:unnamed protein product [Larinioides sclopetarius]|uniref:Cyclase n=1 Tax=Larinioides sclopetarius TaxID=280406 RepID=A0AAV1ZB65_9ARAC
MLLLILCGMVSILHAAPLAQRIIDLTYTFDETTLFSPVAKGFKVTVLRNGTADDGIWILYEEYSSYIHVGTHIDAPAHFTKDGLTVEQIPIDHFIAPAAVIDITDKAQLDPDAETTVEDLLYWESITGQSLNETIVLLKSGWGRKWNNRADFFGTPENDASKFHFPGLAPEAAVWLVQNRNIYAIGVETLSFDKGSSKNFMSHQTLLGHGIYAIENMANMDKIPIYGAKLYVMPMKIGDASGAPTRIIAVYPEVIFDNSPSK